MDRDKRLAWLAMVIFVDLAGHEPGLTDEEAFSLVRDVASTDLDVTEVAQRLRLRPVRSR